MANFSRDTFDKIKHYVSVRLQQGVPLVDADWNEQDDIRRYEMQNLLKCFIGNGVPQGNNGFCILPIAGGGVNTIVLTSNTASSSSSIIVNRTTSTAADVLGFGSNNASTLRPGSSPARLTGDFTEPFVLADGMTFVLSADGLADETVTFSTADFADISAATAAEVITAINNTVNNLTASVGAGNDFNIQGGDGTADGAGRCLVDGWDAIIESDIKYTAQPLYANADLAAEWGVESLPPLTTPTADRSDIVYVDIWERQVDSEEDLNHLVNPAIGLETCLRIKREWTVRVEENTTTLPVAPDNHVYFLLATLSRNGDAVTATNIRDRRSRSGLLSTIDLDQTMLKSRVKIIKNAIENLSLRSRIDSVSSASLELSNIVVEAFSEAAGFQRLVDRFNTTATFGDLFYFTETDGTAQVQTQILLDTDRAITGILVTEKSRIFGPLPIAATTVDVSLNGGTSFDLTGQPLDAEIDTMSLAPNAGRYQLVLRFNIISESASSGDIWTTRADLPAARSHLSAVTGANNHIYALGGSHDSALTPDHEMFEYDPDLNTWVANASLNKARALFGAAATCSRRVYAVGGTGDSGYLEEVEQYNIENNIWIILSADLPTALSQIAVAAISNEKIYAVGGIASSGAVDANQEFDPFTETWTSKAALPSNRQKAVATVNAADEILVFGGITPGLHPKPVVDTLQKYNPGNNSWTTLNAMSAPRSAHAGAGVSNDFAYALGGFATPAQTPTKTTQEYDPNQNTWTVRANMPKANKFAAAASVSGNIHVLGGWDNASNALSSNRQYTPLLTTKVRLFGFGVQYKLAE